ncbi:Tc5 transposase DNA-binding domain, partial [Phytophthora infestans]
QKHVINLSYEQNKRICQWREEHPSLTQNRLTEKAQIELALVKRPAQATISTILKESERYLSICEDRSTRRSRLHRAVMLEGSIVKAKGARLLTKLGVEPQDQMQFSNGWLQSFQQRHGFKSFSTHG